MLFLRSWTIILLVGCFAYGQIPGIQARREPTGHPISKPLPRRFIGVDPVTIYRGLLSAAQNDRAEAYRYLDDKVSDMSGPGDARIYAVNLDSDADLEYVLLVSDYAGISRTNAFVFDRDARGWWVVGEFRYSWHWDTNEAERFVGLREIIWPGRKEIIVRDYGGGTGVAETGLSIYRMHDGYLYRVFHMTEDAFYFIIGAGRAKYEHRTIEYPEHYENDPVFLTVHYEKRLEADPRGRPAGEVRSCSVFRWDATRFLFGEDKLAPAKLCVNQRR